MTLSARIANVQARIHSACDKNQRQNDSVQLLAVSKTRDAKTVRNAYECGIHAFGENYLQEALEKQQALQDCDISWHFIGPIQSNKTKDIANHFDWVHSIDRDKIVQRLASAANHPLNVCIQVNISEEDSKAGCQPNDVKALAQAISAQPMLKLRGLMAIPAASDNQQKQQDAFAKLRQLFIELRQSHPNIDTLSMGMSADLEAAIAEGSTIVRIGTDIFGPRDYRKTS